jgi:indolepyruvate ferredoxin oxidoreductase
MGGEGAAWIGQAPFTDEKHVFVNLGDGTYQHSGILAIRAAVAAKVPVTYKILVNGAVAMTGGQPVDGEFSVPQLTRQLAAEGVERIVLVADDPTRYSRRSNLAQGVDVVHRDRLEAVQQELRTYPGVSVLIYDQLCAAEARRKRKRGQLEDPARHVVINERVCEGCGDCVVASNCLSVEPVQTELGTKRRINHSSCNKDESCLKGLCPSFVVVKGGKLRQLTPLDIDSRISNLPAPELPAIGQTYDLVLTGIGGTGVTTVAALLAMAAHLEGKASATLDMTGLAQKGGGVLSHVRIARRPEDIAGPRVPPAGADVLLAFDTLGAVTAGTHELLTPGRTSSIVNDHTVPTAELVLDSSRQISAPALLDAIRRTSRTTHAVDAIGTSELLLGDSIPANVFLLGYAYQKGVIPLGLDSISRAIELNAVAVETNRRAFAWGRLVAGDEKIVKDLLAAQRPDRTPRSLDELLAHRSAFLAKYQNGAYAKRYLDLVETVRRAEQSAGGSALRLTDAVARAYFKLLAYKDEYEVARLYTDGEFQARLSAQFEGDFQVEYQLAPPLWASRDPDTGRLRKRSYGRWIVPAFRALAALRFLRGTPLDLFGYLAERRAERAWIAHYEATVAELLSGLRPENLELAREIAALPERLRGYDVIKQRNDELVKHEEQTLLARFRS